MWPRNHASAFVDTSWGVSSCPRNSEINPAWQYARLAACQGQLDSFKSSVPTSQCRGEVMNWSRRRIIRSAPTDAISNIHANGQ